MKIGLRVQIIQGSDIADTLTMIESKRDDLSPKERDDDLGTSF